MRSTNVAKIFLGCACFVLMACNPLVFDDLASEAPVISLSADSDDNVAGFGVHVASVRATKADGSALSFVFAGGDGGRAVSAFLGQDEIGFHNFDREETICGKSEDCAQSAFGTALVGIPHVYSSSTAEIPSYACVAISDVTGGMYVEVNKVSGVQESKKQPPAVYVGCADDFTALTRIAVPGGVDNEMRVGGFGSALASSPASILFISAPRTTCKGGDEASLYWWSARLPENGAISVKGDSGDSFCDQDFGSHLGLVQRESAAEGSMKGVLLGFHPKTESVDLVAGTIEVDGTNARFISKGSYSGIDSESDLAFRDVDGEIWLAVKRAESSVQLLKLNESNWSFEETAIFACPGEAAECEGFGSAIALLDVNGDGAPSLFVGAPRATVDGNDAAGIVYGFELDGSSENRRVLLASPNTNDNFGISLGGSVIEFSDGKLRDELIIGASGRNRAYVYLCSGLMGDSVSEGIETCRL